MMQEQMSQRGSSEVVGLVPAAGKGTRIAPLPCSKELYPIGFRRDGRTGEVRPKVASHHLFEKFRRASVSRAIVMLREGKWDIPGYYGDGAIVGVDLAYMVVSNSIGPPDTLDRAFPFVADASIAFGFPDILFGPDDVFEHLLHDLANSQSDLVVGLYPAIENRPMDVIQTAPDGRVTSMILKDSSRSMPYTWACAVWTPAFTKFMHSFVARERARVDSLRTTYLDIDAQGDLPVGAVIKAAVENGMRVSGHAFPQDTYLDVGTPENLIIAIRNGVAGG